MKRLIITIFVIVFYLASHPASHAQKRRSEILQEPPATGHGSITLVDGTTFRGLITFKDNEGLVLWQGEDKDDTKTLTPKNLLSFTFATSYPQQRTFHSMEYQDSETGVKEYCFFELLREFESFAILSKIDRIKTELERGLLGLPRPSGMADKPGGRIEASQTETIFFMNVRGELHPYVKLIDKETERLFYDSNSSKNKFIDRDVLRRYTGEHYAALETFAQDNKLSFKRKEDLLMVMEHYRSLVNK
jgi:hypothetical protein